MKHYHLKNIFLCLCLLWGINAFAESVEIDGVNYNFLEDSKAEVTKGSYTGDVTIPESVTFNGITYSVTSIGDYAFASRKEMTSVTIPASVTNIGEYAFYGCSALTSVTIPEGVTSIGHSAFSYCKGLTEFTIPESVTNIGEYSFYSCSKLESITIPENVTNIGNDAFGLCRSLKSAKILGAVTAINNFTFYGCSDLTSVTIPESVTSIARDAFSYCYALTSVTLPDNVTSIGNYAFYNCLSLTSVNIPAKVTFIGENAFYGCKALASVDLPKSLTEIGTSAFGYCNGLTSINITDLAAWCNIAFESASSNPLTYAHKLCLNGEEVKNLVIPESVTSIESFTFSSCTSLASISFPEGLTNIGRSAFADCTGLTQINCHAVQPPTVTSDSFSNVDVTSVLLLVPGDSEAQYSNHSVWGQFIVEPESGTYAKESYETGINSANVDAQTVSETYDLNGRRQNALQHGLNLIRMSDGSVKKVLVK